MLRLMEVSRRVRKQSCHNAAFVRAPPRSRTFGVHSFLKTPFLSDIINKYAAKMVPARPWFQDEIDFQQDFIFVPFSGIFVSEAAPNDTGIGWRIPEWTHRTPKVNSFLFPSFAPCFPAFPTRHANIAPFSGEGP